MDTLVHSTAVVNSKKRDCLRAYFDGGEAKWSDVVKAIEMPPINNKRVAKKIKEEYVLERNKDEL